MGKEERKGSEKKQLNSGWRGKLIERGLENRIWQQKGQAKNPGTGHSRQQGQFKKNQKNHPLYGGGHHEGEMRELKTHHGGHRKKTSAAMPPGKKVHREKQERKQGKSTKRSESRAAHHTVSEGGGTPRKAGAKQKPGGRTWTIQAQGVALGRKTGNKGGKRIDRLEQGKRTSKLESRPNQKKKKFLKKKHHLGLGGPP